MVAGLVCGWLVGCAPLANNPVPGPDKQGTGGIYGAMIGAGSGAVTGAQLGAGTGPGAVVGAGLGAVWGAVTGLGTDLLEEDQLRRQEELQRTRELAWVQEVLNDHYKRRLELHPSRDIFPADLFFEADDTKLKGSSVLLVQEIASMMKRRMPWSRLAIVSYSTSSEPQNSYSSFLTEKRANEIATQFIKAGVEPRRVTWKGKVVSDPILLDPYDKPNRYRQAVEIVTLDN